ncbi:hypothetical protein K466DRAFT_359365 [Polyporus arcularius HHB13444]|uniref:Uncharacterized protein n=1 Tax=Polyporus arcularius HHB13444 TaxID=1314778 RepID=A0A5C3NY94_9APHY|nr:hypothetical protein K466DRAFT_359365 [Polyporus arcularius HHB13444]
MPSFLARTSFSLASAALRSWRPRSVSLCTSTSSSSVSSTARYRLPRSASSRLIKREPAAFDTVILTTVHGKLHT